MPQGTAQVLNQAMLGVSKRVHAPPSAQLPRIAAPQPQPSSTATFPQKFPLTNQNK
jgi:hypothetical protein